mgnify:CR=1 FL=1
MREKHNYTRLRKTHMHDKLKCIHIRQNTQLHLYQTFIRHDLTNMRCRLSYIPILQTRLPA